MTRRSIIAISVLSAMVKILADVPEDLLRLSETPDSLLTPSERTRAEWVRSERMKNPVGQKACDFSFLNRDGQTVKLHDLRLTTDTRLLFYDPDCDICHELMTSLSDSSVVAIAIEGSIETWRKDAVTLPRQWTVGYAVDDIDGIYAIWDIPTIITISPEFIVIKE